MRTLLVIVIIFQLWQAQGNSKRETKPCGLGGNQLKINESRSNGSEYKYSKSGRKAFNAFSMPSPPWNFAHMWRQNTIVTTTTKIYLLNDCDYINYYCLKGYQTGRVCAKTIYNTYETFESYCELDYMNCMENYDMWAIAHMGRCYNVTSFQTFAYYAYAIWDDAQLEELYVMPQT